MPCFYGIPVTHKIILVFISCVTKKCELYVCLSHSAMCLHSIVRRGMLWLDGCGLRCCDGFGFKAMFHCLVEFAKLIFHPCIDVLIIIIFVCFQYTIILLFLSIIYIHK